MAKKGKPVAVLLRSESEEDVERLLMGHSPKLQSILEAARKRFRQGRGIPHGSFGRKWKQSNRQLALSEVTQERMVERGDEIDQTFGAAHC